MYSRNNLVIFCMGDLSILAAIWASCKPILKIYMIIITGFVLAKKKILTVETSRNLSDLVVNVALPALILSKIVANLSYTDAKSIGVLSFVCFLFIAMGGILALLLNYITPNPKIFFGGLICAGMFPNVGDLPIAFIQGIPSMIFDSKTVEKGIAYVCMFTFVEVFVFFNLGFTTLVELDFKTERRLQEQGEEKTEKELEVQITRTHSGSSSIQDVIHEYSESQPTNIPSNLDELSLIRTTSTTSIVAKKYKLQWLYFIILNFKRAPSVAIVLGLFIALIPWLKALFTPNAPHYQYPSAPDTKPPLHFLLDTAAFIGSSEVPLGLLLLGATLGRLNISGVLKGFIVTSVSLAICRLAILPFIGVSLMTKFRALGWFKDDMSSFLAIINWGLPSMTTQIYITAFFTPLKGPHVQMDCMAVIMLTQYITLIISFPILISYALKHTLNF